MRHFRRANARGERTRIARPAGTRRAPSAGHLRHRPRHAGDARTALNASVQRAISAKPVDDQALLDAIAWALGTPAPSHDFQPAALLHSPFHRSRTMNLPPSIDTTTHDPCRADALPCSDRCSPCQRTRTPRSFTAKRSTRSPTASRGSCSSSRRSSASPFSGSSTSCRKKSPQKKKHPQTQVDPVPLPDVACLRRNPLAARVDLGLHEAGAAQARLRHRRR